MKANHSSHQRLAFVVGAPRSGTTLLTHMLHRHPSASATPETHFLVHVQNYRGGVRTFVRDWPRSAHWLCERLRALRTPHWAPQVERTFADCLALDTRRTRPLTALRRIFLSLIRDAAPRPDAPWLIEKAPPHTEHIPLLRHLFPEATVIHIVRDGRAVAASLARMPWWGRGLAGGMAYWGEWVPRASAWVHRAPNAYEVRYEALARDPESVLRPLLDRMGLGWHPAVLEPSPGEETLIKHGGRHKAGVLEPVDPSRIDAWRARVDEDTTAFMEIVLGDALARMGYPNGVSGKPRPRLIIGGLGGTPGQWRIAEPLIRKACTHLRPGEVRVAGLSRAVAPLADAVTCEDFARLILNAPSRRAAAVAALRTFTNVMRLGRRIHWVSPTQAETVRWARRRWLEGWVSARVTATPERSLSDHLPPAETI